jgi:transposase
LKTGGGRPLPPHLKAQITRELDRLELLLGQIEAVEIERDALLSAMKPDGMNADAVRSREQGVSKAGNPRLRTTLLQPAWLWLRHQPLRHTLNFG